MDTFHEGERAVQARAGVVAEARGLGRGISSSIPPGAQPFLEAQRLAVLAGVDAVGHVWASLVTGNPGFITAPSSRTLRLAARLSHVDPLTDGPFRHRPLRPLPIDPERPPPLPVHWRV